MTIMLLSNGSATERASEGVSVQVELVHRDTPTLSIETLDLVPNRITSIAIDLIDCDVASTCGSDTDQVVLLDSLNKLSSSVMGCSLIFRNLHPDMNSSMIASVLRSRLGIIALSVHCPMFRVEQAMEQSTEPLSPQRIGYSEFNFGFAILTVSSVCEATNLNFIIQSDGSFFDSPPLIGCETSDCASSVSDDEDDHNIDSMCCIEAVDSLLRQQIPCNL
jgi:hypothetical protein